MPGETVTLALDGDVSLAKFADAVGHFRNLLDALSNEAGGGAQIRWVIEGLDLSSAIVTSRAQAAEGTKREQVEHVVDSYLQVGRALERHAPIPFSARVEHEALAIAGIVNSEIDLVRFETPEAEAIIRELPESTGEPLDTMVAESARAGSYGSVEGRVETLHRRGRLRFMLYDSLHNKAVSVYLVPGQEDVMRDAWGKYVIVEGWVTRDPITGRPLSVRQVRDVHLLPEGDPLGYQRARGVAPASTDEPPEETIRRLRDAE